MASGSWIFRRSIPAVTAQAAFSLFFLVAVTAPSLQTVTGATRLQGAEGSGSKTGSGASTEVIPASTDDPNITVRNGKEPAPKESTVPGNDGVQPQTDHSTGQQKGNEQHESGTEETPSPPEPQENGNKKSTSTSPTTPSTPANPGSATGFAGSSAALAAALCAYMITIF